MEYIGTVKLDYQYYSGTDVYNDGDIESVILNEVKNGNNSERILKEDYRWPLLCHLSKERRNLLEWFPFKQEGSLLEIGAGCGALTGLFAEKVKYVKAIELSKRRAQITALRYSALNNLEIVVGDLNEMKIKEKYDYVTLIGVLEYAGMFTKGVNPYEVFLNNCKKYLNKNGVLIIAIENKLGLKYWAGACEDHTGKPFEGITGYHASKGIATFGKTEIKNMLLKTGFKKIDFYYPMPDYKFPTQIFSDGMLPKIGQIEAPFPNYDQDRLNLFNEKMVMNELIKNEYFDIFANSFLIICSLGE